MKRPTIRLPWAIFYLILGVMTAVTPASASVANSYIAQSSAGANDGSSCANAHAASFFNTAGNWGSGTAQIGSDTVVHICGTLNGSANGNVLQFQGSGTSGHPVTLFFETGAIVQAPYCGGGSTGCIDLNGASYILVDGGSTCGETSHWASITCNGTIRNTLAGSSGATCPAGSCIYQLSDSTGNSNMIFDGGNSIGVEIRNLNIGPVYIRLSASTLQEGMKTSGVVFLHDRPLNINIHHNNFTSSGKQILVAYSDGVTTNQAGFYYHHNNFTDQCWGIGMGANTQTGTWSDIQVYENEITNWDKWAYDNTASACHTNGTMFFAGDDSGSYGNLMGDSTSKFYNNYIHGSLSGGYAGSSPSGMLSCQDNCGPINVFNNLIVSTCTVSCGGGNIYFNGPGGGGQKVYNNTLVCAAANSAIVVTGTTGPVIVKNNIVKNCGDVIEIRPNCPTCATSNNNVGYGLSTWVVNNSASSGQLISLATWRGTYSQDLNSVTTDPLLAADYKLQISSPAISSGANLTSLGITELNVDLAGAVRPSSGAWPAGAYSASGLSTNAPSPPSPPTSLLATVN